MKLTLPESLALVAAAALISGTASAQSTISISLDPPPAEPRLQGPFVFGATPASPLVFAIPATGQEPLAFSASALPNGLVFDSATGVLSGTAPAAGSYPIEVTVTNGEGSAEATYTVVAGDTLALTPPMGWNTYDSFGASMTEGEMVELAGAVRTYLQPFGWNTVVIDYRWYEPGQPLDANGRYQPATGKYPSATGTNGFTALAEQVHALGLSFGIHIMRGVPRVAYDANLPIADSEYTTQDAGNNNDACPWDTHMWGVRGDTPAGQAWYDALFAQYAEWGVDFVKIDDMLNNTTRTFHEAEADAIRRAVEKTGRSIVLSFSPGPDDPTWLPNSSSSLNQNANMWRVVNDFWDYNALTDLDGVFTEATTWQSVEGLTPGHWPDLDMLPLGYLGPRNEWHASGQTTFSENEQVLIMSLWTMLPSPLMFGGNPSSLASDEWTLALLTNEEVLAVNQDVLGARGQRTTVQGGEIWVRPLSNNRTAVGFFNRSNQDQAMAVTLAELGFSETPRIRDLWHRADVTGMTDTLTADVPAGAALLFTLSPPVPAEPVGAGGAAGASGAGNVAGNGGAGGANSVAGNGGTPSGGGAPSGGAPPNTNGGQPAAIGGQAGALGGQPTTPAGQPTTTANPTPSGSQTPPTGGPPSGPIPSVSATPSGGATATPTASGLPSASPSAVTNDAQGDDAGCGCRLPGEPAQSPAPAAGLLALLTAFALKRRRSARTVEARQG